MATTQTTPSLLGEIADLLASRPTTEKLLTYRPSKRIQQRARELLQKNSAGTISKGEDAELDQFMCVEHLMGLVKAKLRLKKAPPR